MLQDYRVLWALFVFFAVLSILVLQARYRLWRQVGIALRHLSGPDRENHVRRYRREGWRLLLLTTSLVSMTALAFGALLEASPVLLLVLRALAIGGLAAALFLAVRT
jgi:hypothetical protein